MQDSSNGGVAERLSGCEMLTPDAIKSWLETNGLILVPRGHNTHGNTTHEEPRDQLAPGQSLTQTPAHGDGPVGTNAAASSLPSNNNPVLTGGPLTPTPRKRARVTAVETVDLTADDSVDVIEKPTTAASIKFSNQGIEAHGLVALSKYFAAKMTALDAYIPLSVFNTQWLRQDLLQQSLRKRSVKEKLEDTYIGLTVPLEWKMNFGEWVVAFDLFITYLEYYKWNELAAKFKSHKENVFAVKRENSNWPVAFRYDLAVRTAVMTFRLPDGSVANPAIRDARIEREAIRETERLRDFLPAFKEINPYADGEAKASIDPIMGIDSRNNQTSANHSFNKPTIRSQSFSHNPSFNNLPVYDGPGGSSAYTWDYRRNVTHQTRFRNRRGSWNGPQGARERPAQRRRFYGGNDGGRRDERRDDSRSGERDASDLPRKSK